MSSLNYSELSYENLINITSNFRKSFRSSDVTDPFKKYDEPGFFFWKPLFYFYNGDDENYGLGSSGLLHPSWSSDETNYEKITINDTSDEDNSKSLAKIQNIENDIKLPNSAYNYLLRNDELRRAALLKDFIILLSEINSKTPWYFKEITGLGDALTRSSFYKSPKIDEERKKITIKCLADSVDTRIGNMLDMYRAACFSWQSKREIVPANLRKFDMGIYVYLQPMKNNIHGNIKNVSHKYIEFHNCEIDIDSCKINDSFNNESAQQIEYEIVISYDNCFDNRYSNNVLGLIGDAIITDMIVNDKIDKDVDNIYNFKDNDKHSDYDGSNGKYGEMYDASVVIEDKENYIQTLKHKSKWSDISNFIDYNVKNINDSHNKTKPTDYYYNQRKNIENRSSGFVNKLLNNAQDATLGVVEQSIKNGLANLLLGNIYHGSLVNGIKEFGQGRVISGGKEIFNAATNIGQHKKSVENVLGSLVETNLNKINKPGTIKTTKLGNLNKNKSIANNI